MLKKISWSYFIVIHLALALVIIKSDFLQRVERKLGFNQTEITQHYKTMTSFHARIDSNLPQNSIIFIGDSHIQGLAVSAINDRAVNFGIGNDTTFGVLQRLEQYRSIQSSAAVVVSIGFNDLRYRENEEIIENITKILNFIPSHKKVLLTALLPVGKKLHKKYNGRITAINKRLFDLTLRRHNVHFIEAFGSFLNKEGYLEEKYLLRDNVHLSSLGYKIWIMELRKALKHLLDTE
ncbi:GDSL-type esterase/lipase family protein [Alteromonas flava]|uniref:GDSL-type esterase/lipase family protein n=1 Tax=Alteromonas flava TaxID=2048003 RepID=UPI000C28C12F|nr:GDSL-type esterase/lipase family protein [Alteromonas flava]